MLDLVRLPGYKEVWHQVGFISGVRGIKQPAVEIEGLVNILVSLVVHFYCRKSGSGNF